jgi:hypothetical protein
MENEELAALRATLLAAQRQPLAIKARQARLSALVASGEELLPYVLAASCSDPRDRACPAEDLLHLRVLDGGMHTRVAAGSAGLRQPAYEPPPATPVRIAAILACVFLIGLLAQVLSMLLLHLR